MELGALARTDVGFIQRLVDEAVKAHDGSVSATLTWLGGESIVQQTFADSIAPGESNNGAPLSTLEPLWAPERYVDGKSIPGVHEAPDRYTQISEHGRGGMGRVLLVHDAFLRRDVALKELLPGPTPKDPNSPSTPVRKYMGFLSRFLQEACVTGQLEHPAIVPVYELGHRTDGTLYYTMKLVRGKTLHQAIHGCKSLRERLNLLSHFIDLCQAIAYAHSRGIIHRDIKPDNVMVGEFGETVVLGWGLAKVKGREDIHAEGMAETIRLLNLGEIDSAPMTQYGQVMGTPAYMPPEQAKGQLDHLDERSDVYSLGAVLYELITGKPPFTGKSAPEILGKVTKQTPAPPRQHEPNAPPELGAICERAMQKEPGRRYRSAKELAEDVQRFQSGALVQAHLYTPVQLLGRFIRKYRTLVAGAVAGLLVILALATYSYVRIAQARNAALWDRDTAIQAQNEAELARQRSEKREYLANMAAAAMSVQLGRYDHAQTVLQKTGATFRDWEWAYLTGICAPEMFTVGTVDSPVLHAALSPNTGVLAVVQRKAGLKLYDTIGGKELSALQGAGEPVTSMAFSNAGDRLAVGAGNGTIAIFNIGDTGPPTLFRDHPAAVRALCFDPADGLIASGDEEGTAIVRNLANGAIVAMITAHSAAIRRIEFHPAEPILLTCGNDWTARLWNISAGEELHRFTMQNPAVDAAFSPDGRYLLITNPKDPVTRVASAETGESLYSFPDNCDSVGATMFNPGSKSVFTFFEGLVAERDLASGEITGGFEWRRAGLYEYLEHPVAMQALPGHQSFLITSGKEMRILPRDGRKRVQSYIGHSAAIQQAFLTRDAGRIVSFSEDGEVKVWDTVRSDTGRVMQAAAPSPKLDRGARLFADGSYDTAQVARFNSFGESVLTLMRPGVYIADVSLDSNGASLAATFNDGTTWMAGVADGIVTWHGGPQQGVVRKLRFQPGRGRFCLLLNDGSIQHYETPDDDGVALPTGDEKALDICYSPEGSLLAVRIGDRRVSVFETQTWRETWTSGPLSSATSVVSFSSDSAILGIGRQDGEINLVDTRSWKSAFTLRTIGHPIAVAINPGATRVAVLTREGDLALYDAGTGARILTFNSIRKVDVDSNALTFSYDGKALYLGGDRWLWGCDDSGDAASDARQTEGPALNPADSVETVVLVLSEASAAVSDDLRGHLESVNPDGTWPRPDRINDVIDAVFLDASRNGATRILSVNGTPYAHEKALEAYDEWMAAESSEGLELTLGGGARPIRLRFYSDRQARSQPEEFPLP